MSSLKPVRPATARRNHGDRGLCARQERASPGVAKVHKLSSNESPLGASPRAIEAFRANADQLALYPDGSSRRAARGDRQALRARRRADHLRQRLRRAARAARARLSAARATKGSTASTASSNIRSPSAPPAAIAGRRAEETRPDRRRRRDARQGRRARTKIVFLANPNNPTGTYLPFSEVKRLHAGLPRRRAAGARRGLCRICRAQRLCGRASNWSRPARTSS